MTAPLPRPCIICALVIREPGAGKNVVYTCSRTGINAYTERQNPNGCGPEGKNWTPIVP